MITVAAEFSKNGGAPATGLTLAEINLYLYRRTKAAGTVSTLWTAQHPTEEVGGGVYTLSYTGEDTTVYDYFGYAQYTGVTVLDSSYVLYDSHGTPAITATVAVSAATAASVASGTLAIRAYHTFSQALTSTTTSALDTATKVWLAVKNEVEDTDAQSIIFLEATAGLTYLAGAAYATTTDGTLVVTGSSGAWVITPTIQEAATSLLSAYDGKTLLAEVKALVAGNTVAVWDGTATISIGVVRAYA